MHMYNLLGGGGGGGGKWVYFSKKLTIFPKDKTDVKGVHSWIDPPSNKKGSERRRDEHHHTYLRRDSQYPHTKDTPDWQLL